MDVRIDHRAYPILVVDDDPDIVATFEFNFGEDFTVVGATSGARALEIVREQPIAVLVCDQRMPDLHGADVIRLATDIRPELVPIVLTGFTDYQALVKAMNTGRIYRYVPKPFDADEFRMTLMRAIEAHYLERERARLIDELRAANERLATENLFLKKKEEAEGDFDSIIGKSVAIENVRRLLRRVVDNDATVLLEGATGVGKELVARAIHLCGSRRDKLFVPVNCGAKNDELLEAELFGHVKGSFTGAIATRKGLFELADGGTLFLDEIGEASQRFQNHLLRVLQERCIQRVGDATVIPVDVRVVAATNRDLEAEVRAGRFREDLYFRLKVFPLRVPSLAERREDIPSLVTHFLALHCRRLKRPVPKVSEAALLELETRDYRGNVRELANLIERGLLMTDPGEVMSPEHLFDRPPAGSPADEGADEDTIEGLHAAVAQFERGFIKKTLDRNGGSRSRTAKELRIGVRWLGKKMKRLGLSDPNDEEDDDDEGEE